MNEKKLLETMPDGIAKRVTLDILNKADRKQPMLAMVGALSTVAGALQGSIETPRSINLSLISILVAGSATGKGWVLDYAGKVQKAIHGPAKVHGRIRSGQEMLRTALNNRGRLVYVYDECKTLFSGLNEVRSEAYQKEIGRQFLSICTARTIEMSDDDREEAIAKYAKKAAAAKKEKEKHCENKDEREYMRAVEDYERAIAVIQWIEDGCENPALSFLGATQHENAEAIINERSMQDGLPGRVLFAFSPKKTPPLRRGNATKEVNPSIISELRSIRFRDGVKMKYSLEAEKVINRVISDSDAIIDDLPIMRAVVGRYAEMTERISALLSAGSNVIDAEAVEWAFSLVKYNSDMIAAYLQVETFYSEDGKLDKIEMLDALAARLALEIKSYQDWTPVSRVTRPASFKKHLRIIGRNWTKPSYEQMTNQLRNPFSREEWAKVDLAVFVLRMMLDRGWLDWKPNGRRGLGSVRWVG